jgi:hypothetical protein
MSYMIKILLIMVISLIISCGSETGDSDKKENKKTYFFKKSGVIHKS